MKRCWLTLWALLLVGVLSAQSFDQIRERMRAQHRRQAERSVADFEAYRAQANRQFAEQMRRAWVRHDAQPAEPMPVRPEPPRPVVKEPDCEPTSDPIPFKEEIPLPIPTPPARPIVPMPTPITPIVVRPAAPEQPMAPDVQPTPDEQPLDPSLFRFEFYGTTCYLSLKAHHRFELRGTDEQSVADGWMHLSSESYLPIVAEALAWRDELQLGDWGYLCLLEEMTRRFFTASNPNEAVLMQMFILTQSGYKVRIARSDDRLVLLMPSEDEICARPYLTIAGCRYYVIGSDSRSYYLFDQAFPNEQQLSLRLLNEPRFAEVMTPERTLTTHGKATVSVKVAANRHLIDFYNNYPLMRGWSRYAQASLSKAVKAQLYPALKTLIEGASEWVAANRLLHFVQTALEYQTDEEQFGRERPLFADETLHYPYCDCEDRSILYAILVRDLLGLDVVLLHYPEHLATAVRFSESVTGDYFELKEGRYTVCDPTYIGANVGDVMPQFKQASATIVRVD